MWFLDGNTVNEGNKLSEYKFNPVLRVGFFSATMVTDLFFVGEMISMIPSEVQKCGRMMALFFIGPFM
jgi:hypothetical protein